MALISKGTGGAGFDPVPEGTHVARCVSVVDLGVQESQWGAKERIYIGWEVPAVRVEWTDQDGKDHEGPALIGASFTNSIHEKSILGQLLTSWRGKQFTEDERKGFDLFSILGVPCMISVMHKESNGKTYANVNAVMRLPQGTECPQVETDVVGYSPMDESTAGNLKKLPNWLQEKVRAGFKMAEDSTVVGSSARASAPGNSAREQALKAAGAKGAPPMADPADDWDDDIPFR